MYKTDCNTGGSQIKEMIIHMPVDVRTVFIKK